MQGTKTSQKSESSKSKLLSRAQLCDSVPLYSPWNSPGQNARVGSLSILQGIFPTQGSNPGLSHCRRILNQLSYQGSPSQKKETPIFSSFVNLKTYLLVSDIIRVKWHYSREKFQLNHYSWLLWQSWSFLESQLHKYKTKKYQKPSAK